MNPLVSILIPLYNVENFLPKCLDSVVNQNYQHLQVVIVDDGSADGSLDIALSYSERYSFIEVYHQENSGVAAARNTLLSHVKGEFFIFIDSDDWIELNMISFLVDKANESKADAITCRIVFDDTYCKSDYKQDSWNQETLIYNFLCHKVISGSLCNKLIRSSLIRGFKFSPGISYGEDTLFCWRLFQNVTLLLYTDKELYHYRTNQTSLSRSNWHPDKKGTGHLVWQMISEDTIKLWPQFINIAKTRFAIEDFWALYYASAAGYTYDQHIKLRQYNVRKNFIQILMSNLVSTKIKVCALISSFNYSLLKYFSK